MTRGDFSHVRFADMLARIGTIDLRLQEPGDLATETRVEYDPGAMPKLPQSERRRLLRQLLGLDPPTTWWRRIMKFLIRVNESGRIPRGYGLAWWRNNECVAVCAPMGVNVVLGVLRSALIWLKVRASPQYGLSIYLAGVECGRMDAAQYIAEINGRLEALTRENERLRIVMDLRAVVS